MESVQEKIERLERELRAAKAMRVNPTGTPIRTVRGKAGELLFYPGNVIRHRDRDDNSFARDWALDNGFYVLQAFATCDGDDVDSLVIEPKNMGDFLTAVRRGFIESEHKEQG